MMKLSNKKSKTITLLFLILTGMLLVYPKESLAFSLTGLQLWFNRMVPTLLPFMILSGIMIRLNLTEHVVKIISPVLTPLLRISLNGLYAVTIGFLCGFPMGARVIAQLYASHKLSRAEASYLLAFCNNIGPIYFISFVLPTIGLELTAPYLFGMYGLPLCYGIFLRYTFYRNRIPMPCTRPVRKLKNILSAAEGASPASLLDTLDDSILSGLYGISRLGGYMVLFNLLNLVPQTLFKITGDIGGDPEAALNCLLEITSGISRIGNRSPLLVLLLLPFGGFSCIAQTYSMIKETDLSLKDYVSHKLILSAVTLCYYVLWYIFFPSSFLL